MKRTKNFLGEGSSELRGEVSIHFGGRRSGRGGGESSAEPAGLAMVFVIWVGKSERCLGMGEGGNPTVGGLEIDL